MSLLNESTESLTFSSVNLPIWLKGTFDMLRKKKKHAPEPSILSEEYELISNSRNLPIVVQSLIKEMCALHISVHR